MFIIQFTKTDQAGHWLNGEEACKDEKQKSRLRMHVYCSQEHVYQVSFENNESFFLVINVVMLKFCEDAEAKGITISQFCSSNNRQAKHGSNIFPPWTLWLMHQYQEE